MTGKKSADMEQRFFECGRYRLPIGKKTYIMGILNVTPDSFSDGGSYKSVDDAVNRAKEMIKEGAHIIDVGGESTRPGYTPVDVTEEIERVIPVIERLVKETDVPISVDTQKAPVAEKALQAGAHIVNDIWGLQGDPRMAEVVSKYGAAVIVMHNQDGTVYNDLMDDIAKFLKRSIEIAENSGIKSNSIMIDPGIGFGKTLEQNLEIMRRLSELKALGKPILLGTSRKSMIGKVLDLPVDKRIEGTAATVAIGIAGGADVVRVHDVKEMALVAKMSDAIIRGGTYGG